MVSSDVAYGFKDVGLTGTGHENPDIKDGGRRRRRIDPDTLPKAVLAIMAVSAVIIIFSIILYITIESIPAFRHEGIWGLLTGETWFLNPNYPNDPNPGYLGARPLIVGTVLVTVGAILIAVPMGVGAAIYISEIASERVRNIVKPVIEIFAGIPSVVYGFFGIMILSPILLDIFPEHIQSTSWLAGSILLGIMALPTIISVTEDALRAVPRSYRQASLALGSTNWETTTKVVLPAASSGVIAASILGIGRAMGETMAVIMVAGNSAIIPEPFFNIFSNIQTLTATIALDIPEAGFSGLQYSALFAVALILLVSVMIVNFAANAVGKRTRRKLGIEAPSRYSLNIGKRITDKIDENTLSKVRRKKPLIKKAVWIVMLAAFVWMMASLFVSDMIALLVALTFAAVYLVIVRMSESVPSSDKEKVAHTSLEILMLIILAILAVIIGDIVIKGLPAISTDFIFGSPTDGGIWPAIVGTLQLVAFSSLIAFPIGIGAGIYLSLYAGKSRFSNTVRSAVDALNGTPSIVFGLFGMAVFVLLFGWGTSLISGSVTLALMVLPVIIKTTEEAVSSVPKSLMQASMAMGSSKWQAIYKVVLPAAAGGVITGLVLSLGRVAGETAPIMFTAAVAFRTSASLSPFEPVMSLSYHLYSLAMEPTGPIEYQYGTALVLIAIVLSMFILASLLRRHYSKNTKW